MSLLLRGAQSGRRRNNSLVDNPSRLSQGVALGYSVVPLKGRSENTGGGPASLPAHLDTWPGITYIRYMPAFLKSHKHGTVVSVKVIPGSSRSALSLDTPDVLTVRLTAPPVEGKANKELIRVLAKKLNLAASNLTIISGETSRTKAILIRDMDLETVARVLSPP